LLTEFDISRKSVVSYIRFQYDESDPYGDLEPNIQTIDIEPKDKVIIVSDGVHDYAVTAEMEQIVRDPAHKEAGKAAEALVKFAKRGEDKARPG
jgi:serine/threonine protein phosphatase PrpC